MYYVTRDIYNQYSIFRWYPCEPAEIKFDYTVVGDTVGVNTYNPFRYTYVESSCSVDEDIFFTIWCLGRTVNLSLPDGTYVEKTFESMPSGWNNNSKEDEGYPRFEGNTLVIKYHIGGFDAHFHRIYYAYGKKENSAYNFPAPPLTEYVSEDYSRVQEPRDGSWQKSTFTVRWTPVTDAVSITGYRVQYKVSDSGEWNWLVGSETSWSTDTSAQFGPSGLPDGTTVYFRCQAKYGDLDEVEAWPSEPDYDVHVRMDSTPPVAPVLLAPPNNAILSYSYPYFDWTDVSDISGITYAIQLSSDASFPNGVFYSTGSHMNFAELIGKTTGLNDNTYYWRVRAIDDVGNESPWSEVWSVTIDTVSPGISSTYQVSRKDGSWVEGVLWTNTKTPSLRVTVQDVLSGLDVNSAKYLYKTDNSDWMPLLDGFEYTTDELAQFYWKFPLL